MRRILVRGTRHISGLITAIAAAAVAGLSAVPAASAATVTGAAPAGTGQTTPAGVRRVCPPAKPGQVTCQAVYRMVRRAAAAGDLPAVVPATAGGYGPSSLRSAYNLTHDSAVRGRHETVAIVDAYNDPHAASDLAVYRKHFGLGACTTASRCLRIVNGMGQASPLPRNAGGNGWATEESLDLDMVSAICPHCKIVLVEAHTDYNSSMGNAENAAARLARFVSDSWSGPESKSNDSYNHDFNHPGDAVVAASGDDGYGASYPGDLQYVTSVGGTTLRHVKSGTRNWTETVWGSSSGGDGTGSGCSAFTAKPSWQRAAVDIGAGGCRRRTQNDVAAIGNPNPGVAYYDSYDGFGWGVVGGTSVATPIISATYALAGTPAANSYPASYLYQHPGHFHAVTSGANGTCPQASAYLCTARPGYDGPTGLGTPMGVAGFSAKSTDPVTVLNPGNKTAKPGASLTIKIVAGDSRAAARSLRYTATGLPAGLSVKSLSGSVNGEVSGKVAASVTVGQTFAVVVTARDASTGRTASTHFTITIG
jgi:hypothetical protein